MKLFFRRVNLVVLAFALPATVFLFSNLLDRFEASRVAMVPSFSGLQAAEQEVYMLNSTAYNSLESQTDSTPFITATGERTQSGLVALSRDLLGDIPYGTVIEIVDVRQRTGQETGCLATMEWVRSLETLPGLRPGQFVVEDTMHIRKTGQLDMWLENYDDAIRWGVCEVTILAPASPSPALFAQAK